MERLDIRMILIVAAILIAILLAIMIWSGANLAREVGVKNPVLQYVISTAGTAALNFFGVALPMISILGS